LCGLRDAGFDAFFYEDTVRYADCYDPITGYMMADPAPGLATAREFFGANGFGDKWIFWDELRNGHYGRSAEETREILAHARLAISLAAVNWIPRETRGQRVFIDLDPGVTQIQAQTDAELHSFLSTYAAHFTVGTNIGQPCCPLLTAGFEWHATRPPVALDA